MSVCVIAAIDTRTAISCVPIAAGVYGDCFLCISHHHREQRRYQLMNSCRLFSELFEMGSSYPGL